LLFNLLHLINIKQPSLIFTSLSFLAVNETLLCAVVSLASSWERFVIMHSIKWKATPSWKSCENQAGRVKVKPFERKRQIKMYEWCKVFYYVFCHFCIKAHCVKLTIAYRVMHNFALKIKTKLFKRKKKSSCTYACHEDRIQMRKLI
jgi:hypothetical protein